MKMTCLSGNIRQLWLFLEAFCAKIVQWSLIVMTTCIAVTAIWSSLHVYTEARPGQNVVLCLPPAHPLNWLSGKRSGLLMLQEWLNTICHSQVYVHNFFWNVPLLQSKQTGQKKYPIKEANHAEKYEQISLQHRLVQSWIRTCKEWIISGSWREKLFKEYTFFRKIGQGISIF